MSDPVENQALISIARGCGFAGLATLCGMVGISFNPTLALKLGGYSALLTSCILLLMAWRAPNVPYSRTEVWLMLAQHERPPKPIAQTVITGARRRALYQFASHSARLAVFLLVAAMLMRALLGR